MGDREGRWNRRPGRSSAGDRYLQSIRDRDIDVDREVEVDEAVDVVGAAAGFAARVDGRGPADGEADRELARMVEVADGLRMAGVRVAASSDTPEPEFRDALRRRLVGGGDPPPVRVPRARTSAETSRRTRPSQPDFAACHANRPNRRRGGRSTTRRVASVAVVAMLSIAGLVGLASVISHGQALLGRPTSCGATYAGPHFAGGHANPRLGDDLNLRPAYCTPTRP